MLEYFAIVARLVMELNGEVSFEWPRRCEGWAQEALINLIAELGLAPAACDGCMLGVRSKINDEPMQKPWQIVSTLKPLVARLATFRCDGSHQHMPCQGQDTV